MPDSALSQYQVAKVTKLTEVITSPKKLSRFLSLLLKIKDRLEAQQN